MPRLRRPWAVAVVAVALLVPAALADGPSAPDPVEALRDALRRPAADELARTAALTPAADALHWLGDLGRALLLDEWRDDDRKFPLMNADKEARDKVLARFEEQVRQAMAGSDAVARQAAATLIGETAVRARVGGGAFDPAAVVGRAQVREHLSDLAPDLIKLLRDDSEAVRAAAARALGKVQPEPGATVRALGRRLDPEGKELSDSARAAAAAALDELLATAMWDNGQPHHAGPDRDTSDAELLHVTAMVLAATANGIEDREARVRRSCVDAVGKAADVLADHIPDPPRAPLSRAALAEQWNGLRPLLITLNQQLPAVARGLSGDSEARLSACEALRRTARTQRRLVAWGFQNADLLGPDKRPRLDLTAPSEMVQAMNDADRRVRLSALNTLEAMGDDALRLQGTVAALLRKETDCQVRVAAVRTLKALANGQSSDEAVEALSKALADPDADVRQAVPAAMVPYLGNWDSAQKATEALAAAVRRDGGPRLAALQALAAAGEKAAAAAPDVIAVLDDADAGIRTAAAVALGRFGKQGDAARAALRKALDDPEPAVRLAAAAALLSGK